MPQANSTYRSLPGVDRLLASPSCAALLNAYGRYLVTFAIREVLDTVRQEIAKGKKAPTDDEILGRAQSVAGAIARPSLKAVINATGVLLHTNLGRAPLGEKVLADIAATATGYSNVEFDLGTGKRGHRADHVTALLRYLTGAQDCVVVNNNAAGIVLALATLARRKEVLISRGELIEIGGAFRIPDIMRTAGAKMVEVGTTNRTRPSDYENAFTAKTALIMKAHKSNYAISGFTEEVTVKRLADLARTRGIPLVYDIGSGLLRKPSRLNLVDEPDVAGAMADGADLVMFSCDKLLGGPQAGIVAGRADLVSRLAKAPLMRALRVGKLTLAALSSACRHYLSDNDLGEKNPTFAALGQGLDTIEKRARLLAAAFDARGVAVRVVPSSAQVGGGTLPGFIIESRAVQLIAPGGSAKQKERFAERAFHALLRADQPVLGVLREGELLFDVFALADSDCAAIARTTARALEDGRR